MAVIRYLLWIIIGIMVVYVVPTAGILSAVKQIGDRNEIQKVEASTAVQ